MKKYNFPETVCRTYRCTTCAENHQPKKGTIVTTFGSDSQSFLPFVIDHVPSPTAWGLTLHLIFLPEITTMNDIDFVSFETVCGINGCGIQWEFDGKEWSHTILRRIFCTLKANQFQALINYKDQDYYVESYVER